jgi:hypothetical protein
MSNIDPTMGGATGAATDEGAGQTASAKEMLGKAGQTVRQEAAHFASQAGQRAAGEIEKHKQTATETLGQFANAIRRAGDELSASDQSMASRFVGQAADGLETFARTLSDKRPEELLDTARDLCRRNPTVFVAGTVLAGLALGRFLRASDRGGEVGFMAEPAGPDWSANQGAGGFTGMGEDTGATDLSAADTLESQVSGDIGGVSGATSGTTATPTGASPGGSTTGDGLGSTTGDGLGSATGDGEDRGGPADRSRFS